MSAMEQFHVLFVDDDFFTLQAVERVLCQQPYTRYYADGGEQALEIMKSSRVDVVVSDLKMSRMDGLRFLGEVRVRYPDTVRMVLSAYADTAQILPCVNQGEVFRFLIKPVEPVELQRSLDDAFLFSRKIAYQKGIAIMLDEKSRVLRKKQHAYRQLNQKLAMLTNFDERSGLYSQGHVWPALASEIKRCTRWGGDFSCLQIRLDDYRWLADETRLFLAERLLAGVARMLIGNLPESATAFRLSRDTILIVSSEMTLQKMDNLGWWLTVNCRETGVDIDDQPYFPRLRFGTAAFRLNLPKTAGELIEILESCCNRQARQASLTGSVSV